MCVTNMFGRTNHELKREKGTRRELEGREDSRNDTNMILGYKIFRK